MKALSYRKSGENSAQRALHYLNCQWEEGDKANGRAEQRFQTTMKAENTDEEENVS